MIIMNKYCKSKWDRTRPAYTIRERKYKRIEVLNTSNSVNTDSNHSQGESR
jgi:hypothetical protein